MRMSGNFHTTTTTVVLFCFLALVAVTQARPRDCQDAIENCEDRAKDFCDGKYSLWAMKHCRKTCGLCDDNNDDDRSDNTTTEPEEEEQELPPIQLASPLSLSSLKLLPQQLSQPFKCKDYYAHCHYYKNKDFLCNTSDSVKDGGKWAESYCSKYCGFCDDDDTVSDNSNPNSNSNATLEDVDTEMSKSDDNKYNENDNVFKQMCEYNGERFEHGIKFNAGCGICDCDDGSISCMDVKCPKFDLPPNVCFWTAPSDRNKCCDEPYCYDGRKIEFPVWWKEQ